MPFLCQPMAEIFWYYAKNEQQYGPISSGELKQLAASLSLAREDLVWREGMENWAPAGKVKGLFADIAEVTTTVQTTAPVTSPSEALASPEMAAMLETLDAPPASASVPQELFSTSESAATPVSSGAAKSSDNLPLKSKSPTPPRDLLWVSQFAIWSLCAIILVTAGLVFVSQYLKADDSHAEFAAASVFLAFALGAYLCARTSERIAALLLTYFRRNSK